MRRKRRDMQKIASIYLCYAFYICSYTFVCLSYDEFLYAQSTHHANHTACRTQVTQRTRTHYTVRVAQLMIKHNHLRCNNITGARAGTFVALIPAFVRYYFARRLVFRLKAAASITFPASAVFFHWEMPSPRISNFMYCRRNAKYGRPGRFVSGRVCPRERCCLRLARALVAALVRLSAPEHQGRAEHAQASGICRARVGCRAFLPRPTAMIARRIHSERRGGRACPLLGTCAPYIF
jgi:hypothetical protein